jgi:hypothetical protein
MNLSNMLVIKQLSFLQFREAVVGIANPPIELFSYDTTVIKTSEGQAVKVAIDPSLIPDQDQPLSAVLSAAYPNTPWIETYFVISTFPAMFGYFVCEEFAQSALAFLRKRSRDPLLPRLVGAFLFNNLLFRDRLHDLFFEGLQGLRDDPRDCLGEIFLQAFRGAVPYLSAAQLQAVRELRDRDERQAVGALFEHCLLEIVRYWEYSRVFSATDIVVVSRPVHATIETYADVRRDSPLLAALVSAKEHADDYLTLFSASPTSDLPKASHIFFYGGVFIPLSVVDLTIGQRLVQGARAPAGAPGRALEDAFRIRVRARSFPPSKLQFPSPTETGEEMTPKKLEECRELHNFLHGIAGGLKWFDLVGRSARHLQPLHCQALVDRLLRVDPRLPITQFTTAQALCFAVRQFHVYARQPMIDELQQTLRGDVNRHIETELARRLAARKTGDLAENLYLAAGDFVSEWKQKKGGGVIAPPSRDSEVPLCRYFLDAGTALADAYFRQRVSRRHWGIVMRGFSPEEQLDERTRSLEHFLKFNSEPSVDPPDLTADFMARQAIAHAAPAIFLLNSAEGALRETFITEVDAFYFGAVLDLMIELESALTPLMDSDAFQGDLAVQRSLLAAICGGVDIRYVRWNVIRALAMLQAAELGALMDFPEIGNQGRGILERVAEPLARLRAWVGLRGGALKMPGLGPM